NSTMDSLFLNYYIGFPNKENVDNPWGHWKENWVESNSLIEMDISNPYKLIDYMLPAGDLSMNIIDYSEFIQLNLKGLLGESNYLNANDFYKLHFEKEKYSYGWGNFFEDGNKVSSHDGSAGTYYCHTYINPSLKI